VIVEIITKWLCHGYDIRNAYDGEEAVSIAKEFNPDCVVTGFMMPRMDGLREAAAILQFQPSASLYSSRAMRTIPQFAKSMSGLAWISSFCYPNLSNWSIC
jgi:CheY-like chemotaxis protein